MEQLKSNAKKYFSLSVIGFGAGYALMNPEVVSSVFGQAIQEKAVQFGIAFLLAAWVHSGRVKKEIAVLGQGIIVSVNAVADALRQDIAVQTKRMDGVQAGLDTLTSRVEKLEKGD